MTGRKALAYPSRIRARSQRYKEKQNLAVLGMTVRVCRRLLLAFVVGEAFVGPVGFETGGKDEDMKLGEAEIVERGEGRTDIGAMIERAATAIDDEIGGAGEGGGPRLDLREAVSAAARAVVLGAFDVAGGVEALKTDEEDEGGGFRIRKFLI
jgi:hypothetical protein